MKNINVGLKLWSSNLSYKKHALKLYDDGIFDYVELFVVPGSKEKYLHLWKDAKFSFILHAPHSDMGLNFSLEKYEANNRKLLGEVDVFRLALNPGMVIFHPGTNGRIEETVRQIEMFKNEFPEIFRLAVIENKPKLGLKGEVCIGSSPNEIENILHETGLGFCLDIGHAICFSAWKCVAYEKTIDEFLKLNPKLFHCSDGDVESKTDMHLNLGKGNFKLKSIIPKLPSDAHVSIETDKGSELNLDDFREDVIYFRKCIPKN